MQSSLWARPRCLKNFFCTRSLITSSLVVVLLSSTMDEMPTTSKEFSALVYRKRLNDMKACRGVAYVLLLCVHVARGAATITTMEVCASVTSWEQPILALGMLYVFCLSPTTATLQRPLAKKDLSCRTQCSSRRWCSIRASTFALATSRRSDWRAICPISTISTCLRGF